MVLRAAEDSMTTNTYAATTPNRGLRLREARESAGITRVTLAGLAGCSLGALASIEQGAVPRRSAVLERAWAALDGLSGQSPDKPVIAGDLTTNRSSADPRRPINTANGGGRDVESS